MLLIEDEISSTYIEHMKICSLLSSPKFLLSFVKEKDIEKGSPYLC